MPNGAPGVAGAPGSGAGNACLDQFPLGDCVDYLVEREAVVDMLDDLQSTRDRRSVPVAEAALASADPVVVSAGLSLLGPFADSSESAVERAAPHVLSPFVGTANLAAEVLNRSRKFQPLAAQYRAGHPDNDQELSPWQRSIPVDLAKLGFDSGYPGAMPYPPGESELSAAHSTRDALDQILAHYQKQLGAAPVGLAQLRSELMGNDMKRSEQMSRDMKALQDEYAKTKDPNVLKRMSELGKSFGESASSSLAKWPLPADSPTTPASTFVIERDGLLPVRVVVVYREALLDRSVIVHAWRGAKYPPVPRLKPFNRRSFY